TRLITLAAEEQTSIAHRRRSQPVRLVNLVRGDLDWITMRCLEKDRNRRYETANGLAMDIKRHLNNEPVLARPPSTAYKLQKAWRRNKLTFTAGGGMVAALALGLGLATWMFFAERDALERATAAERRQGQLRLRAENEALDAVRGKAEVLRLQKVPAEG